MLYREADNETDYPQPIPASDNKIPPYLQQFLPLFMIRFTATSPEANNTKNKRKQKSVCFPCKNRLQFPHFINHCPYNYVIKKEPYAASSL